ncbi:MAG TPA: ATP synthase subunit C [Nitrososphaerales archaeon]|nr:ATP synthase subunit C [Nitrososphaerales archaeon]
MFSSIGVAYGMFALLGLPVHAYSLSDAAKMLGSSALTFSQYNSLARGIGFGLAALGAGVAVGYSGSAAIAAIAEKPNLFGRALIFVVLGEGIAIYGFVIVFILPTS